MTKSEGKNWKFKKRLVTRGEAKEEADEEERRGSFNTEKQNFATFRTHLKHQKTIDQRNFTVPRQTDLSGYYWYKFPVLNVHVKIRQSTGNKEI